MSMIKNDDGPGGKLNDFELAAARLLQHDAVEKWNYRKGGVNTQTTIDETNAAAPSTSASGKSSLGKTGHT